jgi:hypothetical protein
MNKKLREEQALVIGKDREEKVQHVLLMLVKIMQIMTMVNYVSVPLLVEKFISFIFITEFVILKLNITF